MKKYLKNERLWLMIGNIANAGFGFLSIGILARTLSTNDFGAWVIFVTNMGLIEMIRAGFVYQALVKYVSGSSEKSEEETVINSAWQISILLSLFLIFILSLSNFLFSESIKNLHFDLFFKYYPIILILMLPINMSVWVAHAKQKYFKMWLLNFLSSFPFLVFIFFFKNSEISQIIWAYGGIRAVLAVFCISDFKAKLFQIFDWKTAKRLLHFSKYTVVTTLSTNVLKSADILLINAFYGPAMVAIYNIPLKLLDVVEIPLRSWAMSAYPKLSHLASVQDFDQFKAKFTKEVKYFSLMMLPFLGIAFHFSEQIITLYAGGGFSQASIILKIFTIYLFIMPLDRYLGIALDSLDLPHINTLKVVLMASLNIFGDWYVLSHQIGLEAVAIITFINTASGILVGLYFLNKKLISVNNKISVIPQIQSS
jgi:O-antigen/teichoic acid export membrane protein